MNEESEPKAGSRVISWKQLHEDKTFMWGPDVVWPTLEADAKYEWIEYAGKVFIQPNLQHTLFSGVDFVRCIFLNPVFRNVNFENCTFHECEFSSGTLSSCCLNKCRFVGCSLRHLIFLDSELSVEVDGETNLVGVSGAGTTLISESLTLETFAVVEGETMSHTIVKRLVVE